MKMARASQNEIDGMLRLVGILGDVFEDGQFPRSAETGEFETGDPDYFDAENIKHLTALYERIDALMGREGKHCGGLRRVVFGYSVLCDPQNELLDLTLDHLHPHPRLQKLEARVKELEAEKAKSIAEALTPGAIAIKQIIMDADAHLAIDLTSGRNSEVRKPLCKGTVLAVFMAIRDAVRPYNEQLADELLTPLTEAAQP